MKQETFTLLVLLIILSVINLVRSLVYILFDKNLADIGDKFFGFATEPVIEGILAVFSILRLIIVGLILGKRGFKSDILTYILMYFIFNGLLKIYYVHVYFNYPDSKEKYIIEKYEDINAIILFLTSLYVVSYIFFNKN
jgi:hypothetical protein